MLNTIEKTNDNCIMPSVPWMYGYVVGVDPFIHFLSMMF